MEKKFLFVSSYYRTENIKDGMMQRIKAVDDNLSEHSRVYLDIRFHKYFTKKTVFESDKIKSYEVNFFLHLVFILKHLRRCDIIYFHSIYNVIRIFPLFLFFDKKTILDIHGVVPEELKDMGYNFKARIYSVIENIAFKKITLMIFVTEGMADHFRSKYPDWNGLYTIYYIISSNIVIDDSCLEIGNDKKVNVIYSGNTQSWQNIDLMLDIIKANLSASINYIILTGEPDIFKDHLKKHNIDDSQIEIKSVSPPELGEYYKKAHYGFILRDDIVVNRVANPTKLIEYLCYGIIPIVKSAQIGDFLKLNYEYLPYTKFSDTLSPSKSLLNITIAKTIINNYTRDTVFNDIIKKLS